MVKLLCPSCGSALKRQEPTARCVVDASGITHRWITDEAQTMSRYLRCVNLEACGLALTAEDL